MLPVPAKLTVARAWKQARKNEKPVISDEGAGRTFVSFCVKSKGWIVAEERAKSDELRGCSGPRDAFAESNGAFQTVNVFCGTLGKLTRTL